MKSGDDSSTELTSHCLSQDSDGSFECIRKLFDALHGGESGIEVDNETS
jgi:hypothetical protein